MMRTRSECCCETSCPPSCFYVSKSKQAVTAQGSVICTRCCSTYRSDVVLNKHTLQCRCCLHTVSQIENMTRCRLVVMSERHITAAGAL